MTQRSTNRAYSSGANSAPWTSTSCRSKASTAWRRSGGAFWTQADRPPTSHQAMATMENAPRTVVVRDILLFLRQGTLLALRSTSFRQRGLNLRRDRLTLVLDRLGLGLGRLIVTGFKSGGHLGQRGAQSSHISLNGLQRCPVLPDRGFRDQLLGGLDRPLGVAMGLDRCHLHFLFLLADFAHDAKIGRSHV